MLPLVQVKGRFLIVPSDRSKDMDVRQEDAPPDASELIITYIYGTAA